MPQRVFLSYFRFVSWLSHLFYPIQPSPAGSPFLAPNSVFDFCKAKTKQLVSSSIPLPTKSSMHNYTNNKNNKYSNRTQSIKQLTSHLLLPSFTHSHPIPPHSPTLMRAKQIVLTFSCPSAPYGAHPVPLTDSSATPLRPVR